MWFCRKLSETVGTDYRRCQIYCEHHGGHFAFKNQWPLKWPRSLWTFLLSTSIPSIHSLPSWKRKQQPTWRGGLVDDCISLSLRNNSVTHGQQREELLYMHGCGLDRTPGEWGFSIAHGLRNLFTTLKWSLRYHRQKKPQNILCSVFIAVVLTSEHQDISGPAVIN